MNHCDFLDRDRALIHSLISRTSSKIVTLTISWCKGVCSFIRLVLWIVNEIETIRRINHIVLVFFFTVCSNSYLFCSRICKVKKCTKIWEYLLYFKRKISLYNFLFLIEIDEGRRFANSEINLLSFIEHLYVGF